MNVKKLSIGLIITLFILIISSLIFCLVSANSGAALITKMNEEVSASNTDSFLSEHGFNTDEFMSQYSSATEKITYKSENGNNIYIYYICNEKNVYDCDTVILIPSFGYNLKSMLPQAQMLLENGKNVVLFDQRMHGRNTGNTYTFGQLESSDLKAVTEYISFTIPEENDINIGILAQGTGAGAVAEYLSSADADSKIKFAIFEDPFAEAEDFIKYYTADKKGILPESIYNSIVISNINSAFRIKCDEISTSKKSAAVSVPVLVLEHNDSSKKVFELLSSGNSEEYFSNSEILSAYFDENQKYTNSIISFISENMN